MTDLQKFKNLFDEVGVSYNVENENDIYVGETFLHFDDEENFSGHTGNEMGEFTPPVKFTVTGTHQNYPEIIKEHLSPAEKNKLVDLLEKAGYKVEIIKNNLSF